MNIKSIQPHGCYTNLSGLSSVVVYAICKAYGEATYTESELYEKARIWNYITCCRYTGRVGLRMEPPEGCPYELSPGCVLKEIFGITNIY